MSDIDDRMEAQEAEYEMGIDAHHEDAKKIGELEAELVELRKQFAVYYAANKILQSQLTAAAAREERLRDALVKVLAHTAYLPNAPRELLVGLLRSVERITAAALEPKAGGAG